MIKTFRGLMADGAQDSVTLHTNTGSMGYRIVRFQLFPHSPGLQHQEHTVKIYKVEQTSIDNTVNFSDQTLVAAAYIQDGADEANVLSETVIFDKDIFNQDIYLTAFDSVGSQPINYYLELEQVTLDLNQNTVATLKDIRNVTAP